MRLPITLAAATLALAAPPTTGSGGPSSAYDRSISRAIARAQTLLLRDVDLYETHTTWADPWRVRSRYFEVSTTRSHYFGRTLGEGLDVMLGYFQEALRTDWTPPRPLPIFILPDLQAYNQFGDEFGAEHSSQFGSFYAGQHQQRPVAAVYDANHQRLRMSLTHGAAHQFVAQAFPSSQPPTWVDEGLAKYFELHWDFDAGLAEFRRIRVDNNNWIPLRDLLAAPLQSYGGRQHNYLLELGVLFTYLFSYREDTRTVWEGEQIVRAPFGDYLNAMLSGRDFASLPAHRLFTTRLRELEADFRACTFE